MDSHKETQALDLASDQKRKSTYATKVATPSKKINLNLEDGQLSEVQQPAHQDLPNEATLSAEVQELERQLAYSQRFKKRVQARKITNSGLEKLIQVYAAAKSCSMRDEIAETMRHEDWDAFWQVMVSALTMKRRMILAMDLPQLFDVDWYGENDTLSYGMMGLKAVLKSELFDIGDGYLTAIDKLPTAAGFRQAVKDHVLARLREEAKDPLSASVRDPVLARKRDETNSKKLSRDATTKLLEIRDDLKLQISSGSKYASRDEVQQIRRCRALKCSVMDHEDSLRASGYTVTLEPNFDINLLGRIAEEHGKIWYNHTEKAQTWDYRFQMRLHSFIASLKTSSDTVKKNNTLALIEKCIATGPEDLLTDEGFWQIEKK